MTKMKGGVGGRKSRDDGMLDACISTCRQLVIAIALAFLALTPVFAQTKDPYHVELLFSADDQLCKPLARLYNRLSHTHHKKADWEQKYASDFRAIGLVQPSAIERRQLFEADWLDAYFRVELADEGRPRLVYVEDYPLGSHGDFQTNVWILKPASDARGEYPSGVYVSAAQFPPNSVDLAVLFGGLVTESAAYRHIKAPYYFKKIATPARLRSQLAIWPGAIQRIFKFGRGVIFTARGPDASTALVYRFEPANTIEDLCYFASQGTIDFVEKKGEP